MKLHVSLAGVVILLGGLLFTTNSEGPRNGSGEEAFLASVLAKPLFVCRGCDVCPGGHQLYSSGSRSNGSGGSDHVDECWSTGACDDWHPLDPNCGGFASLDTEARAALWLAATSDDAGLIRRALAEYPDALKLNSARAALQVYGCDGDIVASIPLSSARVIALE